MCLRMRVCVACVGLCAWGVVFVVVGAFCLALAHAVVCVNDENKKWFFASIEEEEEEKKKMDPCWACTAPHCTMLESVSKILNMKLV